MKKLPTLLLAWSLFFTVLNMPGCKKDDPVQPVESVCSKLTVSNNQPAINMTCTNLNASVTGIQYDSFGRVTSFNFDYQCTTSSERYTGNFFNIQRNSVGQITSYQATVNGQSCRYP